MFKYDPGTTIDFFTEKSNLLSYAFIRQKASAVD